MERARLREYFRRGHQQAERRLIRKLDFFILTFCCLSYFMNYVSSLHHRIPARARRSYDPA